MDRKVPINLPDLHIHTPFCDHASGTMEQTVQKAINLGLSEIGFAGHLFYPHGFVEPVENCVIPEGQFPKFVSEVFRLQQIYKDRITIHLATEADYIKDFVDNTKAMCQAFPFDYVIGSVHILDGIVIDYSESMLIQHLEELGGVEGLWEKYWYSMRNLIDADFCNIVGHFDLSKKYKASFSATDFTDRIDYILTRIRNKGLVIEVNTSGIDRSFAREVYPSPTILDLAAKKNIEMTLGSDAHSPAEVGRHFPKTAEFLKSLGWKRIVVFERGGKQYRILGDS